MSRTVAKETIMAIPPEELLDAHSRLLPPSQMSERQIMRYMEEAGALYCFSCRLAEGAIALANWDNYQAYALKSGWNRACLPTLRWLRSAPSTEEIAKTQAWIKGLHYDFPSIIDDDWCGITSRTADIDTVTEAAEAEIEHDFPAYVILGATVEANLFESGNSMTEASTERLGVALAGLALKRQLSKADVAHLEKLYSLPPA